MIYKNDFNKPKLIYQPKIIKINDGSYVSVSEYEMRGNKCFFDVELNIPSKKIFIGRYIKEYNNVTAKYKDGKILVCNEEFIQEDKKMNITDVYTLYDILDDTHYNLTKIQALNLFDQSINSTYLKDKNKSILRSDIEKKQRLSK